MRKQRDVGGSADIPVFSAHQPPSIVIATLLSHRINGKRLQNTCVLADRQPRQRHSLIENSSLFWLR